MPVLRHRLAYFLTSALSLLLAAPLPAQDEGANGFQWQSASPASQGMSAERLAALRESLTAHKTTGLLVVRNDRIVLEWYAEGESARKPHYTASMAKALVGGVSVSLAISDGLLALDDKASKFVPQWQADPRKREITIGELGSHTSGLADAHQDGVPHEKLAGWMGDFWKRLDPPRDPFSLARDEAPLVFDPGARLQYSNPGIAMLSYATTAALKGTPQEDLRTLLAERVLRPIRVADDGPWSIGYGQTTQVDGLPLVAPWGGGSFTARAAARIGRLMLRQGDWEGQQLISREAVRLTTGDAGTPGNCGIGWWTNNDGAAAKLPRDAFWASGAGHQILLVVPSLKLIAVRNGEQLAAAEDEPARYHEPVRQLIFEPLVAAIVDAGRTDGNAVPDRAVGHAPYPPSPVFKHAVWSPPATIIRQAKGSDNWPLSWSDDGDLYGAYGDGAGFDPHAPKLSLGLARIEGDPANFVGVNLHSPSLEQFGDGAKGRKASGLLSIKGVLYLLARNAGNSKLAWSTDHGQTWQWADWKFTASFGCPTILNFGRDYSGARDEFAYVYSHDANDAYTSADRMVLARVPVARIKQPDAYEYFRGTGPQGQPLWTRDVSQRGAVFTHPGKCYRSGISFHAPSRRYLWCQVLPGDDPRRSGGLGIYDARQPWGPWTTVYYSEHWDVGPGETCSFPTKWMTDDGRNLHLVFSGDDSFSVRKLTVELAHERNEP